jgi:hypothetical protein
VPSVVPLGRRADRLFPEPLSFTTEGTEGSARPGRSQNSREILGLERSPRSVTAALRGALRAGLAGSLSIEHLPLFIGKCSMLWDLRTHPQPPPARRGRGQKNSCGFDPGRRARIALALGWWIAAPTGRRPGGNGSQTDQPELGSHGGLRSSLPSRPLRLQQSATRAVTWRRS